MAHIIYEGICDFSLIRLDLKGFSIYFLFVLFDDAMIQEGREIMQDEFPIQKHLSTSFLFSRSIQYSQTLNTRDSCIIFIAHLTGPYAYISTNSHRMKPT